MFSIIIPVAKKDSRYLKRVLLSIQDQDLTDLEVIVVSDGFKTELPIQDERFSLICADEILGASKARNLGAKKSSGEYLFFLDADCYLFPGALSLVLSKFEREDCDFVYSGYRFNHDTLSTFPSRPFDPYLIESMNYICTMSPMKREVFTKVGGFREKLPYFQDWDFWIRAIKDHGYVGYYLKDFIFMTEVPNRMSISGISKYSWREKIDKIESINNIPKRKICVTTLSAPHQSVERAKALGARYLGSHNRSPLTQLPSQFDFDTDVVILQGFFPMAAQDHMSVFPEDCIKVVNWIGTDVWQLHNKFNWNNLKFLKEQYLDKIDLHLCNSPELQRELADIGIKADVVYQPLTEDIKVSKRKNKRIVSAYCSPGHPLHSEFYIKDLAQSMPDIDFVLFGTKLQDTQDGNIRYMGFVPIQEAIDLTSIHLRITQHDGFPHTPIQFAMGGRRVLCNYKLEYCDYIEGIPNEQTWEKMKKEIVSYIRTNIDKDIEHDVNAARDYYNKLCSPQKYKRKMNTLIKEVCDAKNDSSTS